MKVKDLINQLSLFNPNMEIKFTSSVDGGMSSNGLGLEEDCDIAHVEPGEQFTVLDDIGESTTIISEEPFVLMSISGAEAWND